MVRTNYVGIRYLASMAAHEYTHARQVACYNQRGQVAGKPFYDPYPLTSALAGTGWSFNVPPVDSLGIANSEWNHHWGPTNSPTSPATWEDEDVFNGVHVGDDMCDQAGALGGYNYREDPAKRGTGICGRTSPGSNPISKSLCDYQPTSAYAASPDSASQIHQFEQVAQTMEYQPVAPLHQPNLYRHDWASPGMQHLDVGAMPKTGQLAAEAARDQN